MPLGKIFLVSRSLNNVPRDMFLAFVFLCLLPNLSILIQVSTGDSTGQFLTFKPFLIAEDPYQLGMGINPSYVYAVAIEEYFFFNP